jgi:LDH2 family malate/lactate/ureidoglycolate dehydrogenase
MATTVVAAGKIEIANRDKKDVPEGWIVSKDGKPLSNPSDYWPEGAILPLGGSTKTGSYKGFGLTVAVDILCRVLSGSPGNSNSLGNHFFGALNIATFMPVADFKKAMEDMYQTYRALPKAPGVERITLAGEPEYEAENDRRRNGVPLNPVVITNLQKIAAEIGIEFDL